MQDYHSCRSGYSEFACTLRLVTGDISIRGRLKVKAGVTGDDRNDRDDMVDRVDRADTGMTGGE